jgi:hypothetical protein
MSNAKESKKHANDVELWLRSVLRKDTVPLVTVTKRAKLEGVDMQALWRAIREVAIQVDGMGGQRYLKLPHTNWHGRNPAPASDQRPGDTCATRQAIDAAMARLKLSRDDRIVCPACTHAAGPRCPGGAPTPDLQPTRCNHFKETPHTEE